MHRTRTSSRPGTTTLIVGLLSLVLTRAAPAVEPGIRVTGESQVLYGCARVCQKPAEVDYRALQEATPEFRTIERERIPKGSARHEILMAKMTQRLNHAVRELARQQGFDCVVVKGSIKNSNGLTVVDATAAVLARLDSADQEHAGRE